MIPSKIVKRAIAEIAFKPFKNGVEIPNVTEYHLLESDPPFTLGVSIRTPNGPRFFEISVKERW